MKKRYWLMGAIIGLILGILFVTYLYYVVPCIDTPDCKSQGLIADLVYGKAVVIIYVPLVLIGTIIGLIYGKIRSRKQVGTTMN
jgi:hypothetical protein